MYDQKTLGNQGQNLLPFVSPPSLARMVHDGGLLGNDMVQSAIWVSNVRQRFIDRIAPTVSLGSRSTAIAPTSKLEVLKKQRFTPEGRSERIAKSLAALNQEEPIRLAPEEWRRIAEDPDIEDQF